MLSKTPVRKLDDSDDLYNQYFDIFLATDPKKITLQIPESAYVFLLLEEFLHGIRRFDSSYWVHSTQDNHRPAKINHLKSTFHMLGEENPDWQNLMFELLEATIDAGEKAKVKEITDPHFRRFHLRCSIYMFLSKSFFHDHQLSFSEWIYTHWPKNFHLKYEGVEDPKPRRLKTPQEDSPFFPKIKLNEKSFATVPVDLVNDLFLTELWRKGVPEEFLFKFTEDMQSVEGNDYLSVVKKYVPLTLSELTIGRFQETWEKN